MMLRRTRTIAITCTIDTERAIKSRCQKLRQWKETYFCIAKCHKQMTRNTVHRTAELRTNKQCSYVSDVLSRALASSTTL